MAGVTGLEPVPTVLETVMLPLTPYPYAKDSITYSYRKSIFKD
jgi:hypothetical protein